MRNNLKDTWTLTKANLINLYGIHGKGLGNENSMRAFAYLILIIIVVPMTYRMHLEMGIAIHRTQGVEGLNALIYSSILSVFSVTFFTSSYKAAAFLFSFKDFNMLASFPINMFSILASRILLLYISNLILTIAVGFGSIVAFGVVTGASLFYYIYATVLLLLFPIVPLVLGSIVAFFVKKFEAKAKVKNFFALIGTVLIISASMYVSTVSQSIIAGESMEVVDALTDIMAFYFPATFFVRAIVEGSFIFFLISIVFNLSVVGVFAYLFASNFKKLNASLQEVNKKSDYKIKELKTSSQLKAIYKKEISTYTSSQTYFINSITSMALFTMFNLYMLVFGTIDGIDWNLTFILALVFVAVTCTTNASISIEGKKLATLKSFPIDFKTLALAKVLLNLTVSVPLILINSIFLVMIFDLYLVDLISIILILLFLSLLVSLNGLIINLYFPKLVFKSDVEVVKQSMSAFISTLVNIVIFLLSYITHFVWGNMAVIIVLAVLAVLHFIFIDKVGAKLFARI